MLLMLVVAMFMQAQSLTGKDWITSIPSEDGTDALMFMSFDENGDCAVGLAIDQTETDGDGSQTTITYHIFVPGTYTLKNNVITSHYNKSKTSLDIEVDAHGNEMMASIIKSEMEKIKDSLKEAFLSDIPESDTLTITELTDEQLTVTDSEGVTNTFIVLHE